MAFLALDLLARIVTMRINAGPPCMGSLLSSGLRAAIFLAFLIGFFVRPGIPFLRSNLASYCALARPHLDSFEHDRTVGAVGMTIRGEPLSGRGSNAPRPCIRWVQDPNHDALMRIGGEAPRRRTHSFSRRPQCRHWRSIR